MNSIFYAAAGIILFIIALFLLLGRVRWFHRSELKKSNQPGDKSTDYTPQDLLDDYVPDNMDYVAAYDEAQKADYIMVYHTEPSINDLKMNFLVEKDFLKKYSLKNNAQMFKLLGYTEWMLNPSPVVQIGRKISLFFWRLGKLLLVTFLVLTFLISIFVERNIDFFVEFNGFYIMIGSIFYAVYLVKEFPAYVIQNRFSLKLAKSFNVPTDNIKKISRYLWLSFFLFFLSQVMKLVIIIMLMFSIIMMFN